MLHIPQIQLENPRVFLWTPVEKSNFSLPLHFEVERKTDVCKTTTPCVRVGSCYQTVQKSLHLTVIRLINLPFAFRNFAKKKLCKESKIIKPYIKLSNNKNQNAVSN